MGQWSSLIITSSHSHTSYHGTMPPSYSQVYYTHTWCCVCLEGSDVVDHFPTAVGPLNVDSESKSAKKGTEKPSFSPPSFPI